VPDRDHAAGPAGVFPLRAVDDAGEGLTLVRDCESRWRIRCRGIPPQFRDGPGTTFGVKLNMVEGK